ncbi:MAG: ABC transporter ATP-binding protein [Bacteroidota bacterium]
MFSLHVQGLGKRFSRYQVFSDISFESVGPVLGIAGSNGSGKSTLVKCLGGLLRATKGTVKWSDESRTLTTTQVKACLGFCAPYINLYQELTVSENLTFLATLSQTPNQSVTELLEYVQIPGLGHNLYKELSTGQQQRVKVAASLIRSPDILILDEPGTNLDEQGNALIRKLVEERRSESRFVILASNDERELDLCDQIIQL